MTGRNQIRNSNMETRTKIVATIGPASSDENTIRQLIEAGADVFRLNFSHGTREEHRGTIRRIRAVADAAGTEIAIIQDLCGPKIRVGTFAGGEVCLNDGDETVVTTEEVEGSAGRFSVGYPELPEDLLPDARILLDDGMIELAVLSVSGCNIRCKVVRGGCLRNHKGMNLPGTLVSAPSTTEKDLLDLAVGIEEGVDFVALSFVRHPDDLKKVKEALERGNSPAQIIAKIEKPEAIEHIDAIVDRADGILVARGDLGIEMDLASVAVLQKEIVRKANEQDKYVIVATQMLESMTRNPSPTRAEVSDVTNAILDGADALMLSGETAVGRFPLSAVETMAGIARTTEAFIARNRPSWDWHRLNTVAPVQDAIGRAASDLCTELDTKAVVAFSPTGGTALFLSKHRPRAPIVALTTRRDAFRRMRLFWGVIPVYSPDIECRDDLVAAARRYLVFEGIVDEGERILIIAGTHFGQVGSTNAIEVAVI